MARDPESSDKPNMLMVWLFEYGYMLPMRVYRLLRYNLFPARCPKCGHMMSLAIERKAMEMRGAVEPGVEPEIPGDWLVCWEPTCRHATGLDGWINPDA
jgi:hypothetical protein